MDTSGNGLSSACNKDTQVISLAATMADETDEETLQAATIRAHQGYHETEVSCTDEVGLHKSLRTCQKNPRHKHFIPVGDFDMKHLPSGYQDNDLLDAIRATSDITCRLSVSRISSGRPDTYSDTNAKPFPFAAARGRNCLRTGTGWIIKIQKYTKEDNYEYADFDHKDSGTYFRIYDHTERAATPHTAKKEWAKIWIKTARHVVFDDEEARHTKCSFFYDSEDMDVKMAPTVMGVQANVTGNIEDDDCNLRCDTQDMELVSTLEKMHARWLELYSKIIPKYGKDPGLPREMGEPDGKPDLCIVVSHPHGCNKQITVGKWTQRNMKRKDWIWEKCYYEYNTPTCPGSSGAPVTMLIKGKNVVSWSDCLHPHSEGRPGNANSSGIVGEYVECPIE